MTRTHHSQVNVLIAERTLSIAELIARNLKSQGYGIAGIVNSADQAVELATITVPDIVLLDLPLPGQLDIFTAGWKILSEIQCPVVYMTTQARDLTHHAGLSSYGFLLKPFTPQELKATIDQTLERHRCNQARDRQSEPCVESPSEDQILSILAIASTLSPLPRIVFADGLWQLYSNTTEGGMLLKTACQQHYSRFPYQVFVWNWETSQYQLYG